MGIACNQVGNNTVLTADSNLLPNIPREIIVEILLRLPVETLLRFRCVCKSWRSLISDPIFVQTHLTIASSNTDYTHHRLRLRIDDAPRVFKSGSIFPIMYKQSDTDVDHDYPFDESPNEVRIVGSCNGLVCVAFLQSKKLFLWNPSTGKSRILPSIEVPWDRFKLHERCRFLVYGFGYDEFIDDYKVVLIFQGRVNMDYHNIVMVYTLRTNSWRRSRGCPHRLYEVAHSRKFGKFVSGALHWQGRVESKDGFISLDSAKETYKEISLPDYLYRCLYLTLDVLGGYICMLSHYVGCRVDLWVMKEYGVRESWTKLVVIDNDTYFFYGTRAAAMCILKNGNVLMDANGRFVQFSLEDEKFLYPTIHQCSLSFTIYPYVESLVLPYTGADSGD